MLSIDEELRTFLESDLSLSVATRSKELVPHTLRAWGPRVSPDGRSLEVFLDRPSAAASIANLQDNGRIAACFVEVRTLRSLQLKGRCVEVGDPQPDDWPWIERHRQAFAEATGSIGFAVHLMRNLWSTQVVKIRFVVEEFYDQTPGPAAGRAL